MTTETTSDNQTVDDVTEIAEPSETASEATEDNRDYEAEAKRWGWKSKEDFKGNPDDHKDPKDFVLDIESSIPHLKRTVRQTTRDLRERDAAFAEYKRMTDALIERQKKEFEDLKLQAVEDGNVERFKELEEQGKKLEKTSQSVSNRLPPDIEASIEEFHSRNPVIARTPMLQEAAKSIATYEIDTRAPIHKQLADTEKILKQRYPQYWPEQENPRRTEAAAVATDARNKRVMPDKGKTFKDLPKEAKDTFRSIKKMMEMNGHKYTEDEYLEHYQWD